MALARKLTTPQAVDAPAAHRRTPVQERSQGTVQQIFQAASRLLADLSIDEITTSRIAREAGISVGALYRFFPDKQSIIDAIAVHHVEEFRAAFEGRLSEINFQDGPALDRKSTRLNSSHH